MTADFILPRDADLGLRRIANRTGLAAALLPNGALFALSHRADDKSDPVLVNQVLGSPIAGGIGRLLLRLGGGRGGRGGRAGGAAARSAVGPDRFVWAGESEGLAHRATLWLAPERRSLALARRGREQGRGARPRSRRCCCRISASASAAS